MDRVSNVDDQDKKEYEEIKMSMKEADGNGKSGDQDIADDVSNYSEGQIEKHIKMIEVMSEKADDKRFLFVD